VGRVQESSHEPNSFMPLDMRLIASADDLRYWYLLLSSWPASIGIDLLAGVADHHLGFLADLHRAEAGFFRARRGTLIGAVDPVGNPFRGQLGFSISFLEEMWARNLAPDDEPAEADLSS